jgi:putative N6-adenine-specific DNA methylase
MPPTTNKLDIFVICAPGLETVTGAEMLRIGITPTAVEAGGISCRGSVQDVMRLNLWLRTATRVVVRIASFHASTFHELERRAKKIEWKQFVAENSVAAFRVTCRKSKLYHSDAVAERFAKAVAAQVKGASAGKSSEADDDDAASGDVQQFIVRLFRDEVTVSIDSSGELLHRRGYRLATAKAPMRETMAAAMLLGAEWSGAKPVMDPLCGSGTLATEAALIARNMAPGRSREFAFMNWPGFERRGWQVILADADRKILPKAPSQILASDRDAGAVAAARQNAERAGVAQDVEISERSMSDAIAKAGEMNGGGLLITNPPYGKRVGEGADPRDLYSSLGKGARSSLEGWEIVLVSNENRLISQVGIPVELLFSTINGGIPVQVVKGIVPSPTR